MVSGLSSIRLWGQLHHVGPSSVLSAPCAVLFFHFRSGPGHSISVVVGMRQTGCYFAHSPFYLLIFAAYSAGRGLNLTLEELAPSPDGCASYLNSPT